MGCCEHGNEPRDYTRCGEILDLLRDYQLLKRSSHFFPVSGKRCVSATGGLRRGSAENVRMLWFTD
jgi:hypothetical protein